MPSVSKKQQKFMGIVRSIQKGEQPAGKFSKDAQDAAKSMKKGSVKKYAKTKHDDLPTKKEGVNKFKKLPGKVVAKRMMSIKSLKPYASMIAKKKSVSTIDLERELPYDKVSVKDIDKVMKESLSKSQIKKMRDEFDKTGELPPHLKKVVKGKKEFEKKFKVKDVVIPGMEWMSKLGEERDYKDEYKKFQSSTKSKKYRAELNKYNRKKGTYGNGDGKDASHKGGKIVGFEKESKNRGRAEKSRLKKENNMPDFNPIIDEMLDEVFGEYQMNENSKVIKSIENLATKNKYGDVTGTKMNGKTANLIMKIYNHPKMKRLQKAMDNYTSDELVDMTIGKIPKLLGLKENVTEGSCGYGIDGKIGEEPAGPHLMQKKKKDEGIGDYFSKKISKHGGTRNKAEIENIAKYLMKKGDNKKDALDKIKQNYDYVSKKYRSASVSKKADILTSLQESVNEGKLSEDYKNSEWEVYVADENGKEKIVKKAKSKRAGVILYNKLINSDNYYEVGMRVVKESVDEGMTKQQADVTLKQLGANKFIAMTGAKQFSFGKQGLGFRIGKNSKSINYVRVDLKSNDLYDMEFIRIRGSKIKVVKKVTGVYNDQLQKIFTKHTGLYTSL